LIVLFTDFGLYGPYTGQMKAVLHQMAPGIPVVDLFADAPVGNPKPSAYLLAAYAVWFAAGTVFLCIVDPGVGGARPAIILKADGRWYVGPGNGLFELVLRRAGKMRSWDIDWKPDTYQPAFTGAISSHQSQPCWLAVSRPPAGLALTALIARKTGRMTSARSFTSISLAMP
jgi:S-adenosyl-L-methionine hydrolase (adenosine-forming)